MCAVASWHKNAVAHLYSTSAIYLRLHENVWRISSEKLQTCGFTKNVQSHLSAPYNINWKIVNYNYLFEGYRRKEEHGFSKKMSAEEKARKLAEMAGNAVSHDKIRQKRVADGRKKDAEEERKNEGKKNDHSFYRDMKMKATEKSLEERVKARTSANQKTAAALDKNWTKRWSLSTFLQKWL